MIARSISLLSTSRKTRARPRVRLRSRRPTRSLQPATLPIFRIRSRCSGNLLRKRLRVRPRTSTSRRSTSPTTWIAMPTSATIFRRLPTAGRRANPSQSISCLSASYSCSAASSASGCAVPSPLIVLLVVRTRFSFSITTAAGCRSYTSRTFAAPVCDICHMQAVSNLLNPFTSDSSKISILIA